MSLDKASKVYLNLDNATFEATVAGAIGHVVVTAVPEGYTDTVQWLQTEFRFDDAGNAQFLKVTQWYTLDPPA